MRKGFTLMELLIVIAILALLAAFIVPQLSPTSERAKLSNSVKFFTQSFYEQQTKAQSGYHEMIDTTSTDVFGKAYQVFGLTLSTERSQGARITVSTQPDDPKDYKDMELVRTGKNILAPEDAENALYSTVSEITVGGKPYDALQIYFLPLSNTVILKDNNTVLTDKKVIVTFANSRYPSMKEKIEINTATSLLRSLPTI